MWPALGRDVEAGCLQSHAAAEAGQLHSNPLLPKLVSSAFSCKHGSPVSGSHITPGVSTGSCALDMPSSGETGFAPCGPSLRSP